MANLQEPAYQRSSLIINLDERKKEKEIYLICITSIYLFDDDDDVEKQGQDYQALHSELERSQILFLYFHFSGKYTDQGVSDESE